MLYQKITNPMEIYPSKTFIKFSEEYWEPATIPYLVILTKDNKATMVLYNFQSWLTYCQNSKVQVSIDKQQRFPTYPGD